MMSCLFPANAHDEFNQPVEKLVISLVVCLKDFCDLCWRTQYSTPVPLPQLIVHLGSSCLAFYSGAFCCLSTLTIVSVSRNGPEKTENSTNMNKHFTLSTSKIQVKKSSQGALSQRMHICSSKSQKHSRREIEPKQKNSQNHNFVNLLLIDSVTDEWRWTSVAPLLFDMTENWQKTNYSKGTVTALARSIFLRFK